MSYYYFNRQEILQKAKERYSKEKAAENYLKKQRSNRRKVKRAIQKLVTKTTRLRSTKEKSIKNWCSIKKKR